MKSSARPSSIDTHYFQKCQPPINKGGAGFISEKEAATVFETRLP